MTSTYSLRELLTDTDISRASRFLNENGLLQPEAPLYGVGAYEGEHLIATGFLGTGALMGLCVASGHRGEGIALAVMDHLVRESLTRGYRHLFIFTKASEAGLFTDAGFELLVETRGRTEGYEQPIALLEWGTRRIENWLHEIRMTSGLDALPTDATIGAVVVNANPLTRGHLSLIEQASKTCDFVFVFVVREDVSVFSFSDRFELVRQGVCGFQNCCVLSGDEYIISRHTFPSYFTGDARKAQAHADLDATLFAARIAKALGISIRFAGTEPFSPVTAQYNMALRVILPMYGVRFLEVPRCEEQGEPVSASRVRMLFDAGDIEGACALVPPCTAHFLRSLFVVRENSK